MSNSTSDLSCPTTLSPFKNGENTISNKSGFIFQYEDETVGTFNDFISRRRFINPSGTWSNHEINRQPTINQGQIAIVDRETFPDVQGPKRLTPSMIKDIDLIKEETIDLPLRIPLATATDMKKDLSISELLNLILPPDQQLSNNSELNSKFDKK